MNRTAMTKSSGFTLIELLVSIAILVMIMVALTSVVNQTSKTWTQAENRVETFQGSRLALDMIGRELEGALVTSNNLPNPYSNYIPFQTLKSTKDADINGYGGTALCKALNTSGNDSANDQIFFVAPGSDSSVGVKSDLHEYGYFVIYATSDTVSLKGQHYYLIRMDNDGNSSGFDVFSNANWYKTPVGGFGNTVKTPFLDNVLRFGLDYVDTNGIAIPPGTPWPKDNYLPRTVTVTLTVLDRRAAATLVAIRPNGLTAAEQADIPDNIGGIPDNALKQLLLKNGRTFFKRVDLINSNVAP